MDRVYAALSRVPLFGDVRREDIEIERLGSLTNASYKITVNGESYVLRLPGKGTSDYIGRAAEEHNARIASVAGINATTLFFDASDRLMLGRFIEGTTIDETRLNSDLETLARVARSLRRMRRFEQAFRTRFDVFAEIDAYMAFLHEMRTPLPKDFGEVKRGAGRYVGRSSRRPCPLRLATTTRGRGTSWMREGAST